MPEGAETSDFGNYGGQLVAQLRAFGDVLKVDAPEFDVAVSAARLRQTARRHELLSREAIFEVELWITGEQLEEECPPFAFDLEASAARLPQAAQARGLVPVPEKTIKPDPDRVLTWRQRKILQVIRDSVQKRGHSPSMREIGAAVGLTSTSGVSHQLSTLQRRGYVHRDMGRPRAI